MKRIVASLLLSISTSLSAQVVYIGSFYSKLDGPMNIIYKSNDIKTFIENHDFKKTDRVALSSGIENSCGDYKLVKSQIDSLSKKVSKIYLIRNESCFGVSSYLKMICHENKKCDYVNLYEVIRK